MPLRDNNDRDETALHEIAPGEIVPDGCHGELTARDVRLDHRYLWLALETVRGDRGEHTYVRGTGPDIVYVVPRWADGSVTLIAQRRHGIAGRTLEVPAGQVEAGEEPAAAALRELREETGLVAESVVPLLTSVISIKLQQRAHLFLATGLSEGPHDRDADEDIELRRMPYEEAARLALAGEVHGMPCVAALLAAGQAISR